MDMSSEFSLLPLPKNLKTKRKRPTMLLLLNKRKSEEELTKSFQSKLLKPMLLNSSVFSPVKLLKRRLPRKSPPFTQSRALELERLKSSKDQKSMPLNLLKCTKMTREIFQRLKEESLKVKEAKKVRRRNQKKLTKQSIC